MLGRSDALAVAASCAEKLRGCGEISISSTPLIADDHSRALPWLEIAVEDEILDENHGLRWTHLREAVAVLHALSRCVGYAPHLNIVFWRGMLGAAGVGGALRDLSAVKFDPEFPRFRLLFSHTEMNATAPEQEASRVANALSRFFAMDLMDSIGSASFTTIMTKLQPFQSPSRVHPVEIALSLPSMDTQWLFPAIARLASDLRGSQTVELKEITLNQRRYKPQDPLQGVSWLTDLEGVASFTDWTLDESIEEPRVFAELYRRVLGLDGSNVTPIQMLHLERSALSDAQFAGLSSALPFSRTVQNVRIFVDPDWDWDALSSEWDWAWLGYALFHEKTADSMWRGLVLEGCGISLEHAEIVEKVRRHGVRVLREYVGCEEREDGTRQEETVVQVKADTALYSVSHEVVTTVEKGLPSQEFDCLQTTSRTGFASIIVPGYGLVLLESENIASLQLRPAEPRSCSLRYFTASHDHGQNKSVKGLHLFLQTCGEGLRSMDLLHHEALGSVDVYCVLQSCHQLEEVALNHDGSLWSSPLPSQSTNLTAIRLSCSLVEAYCLVPMLCGEKKTYFPSVKALYFHVTKGAIVFHSISKALGGHLLESASIEDFDMVKVRPTTSPSPLSTERLAKSLSAMRISPCDLTSGDFRSGLRLKTQTLAVVEVICLKNGLPNEIRKRVETFVAVENRRHVWVDLF